MESELIRSKTEFGFHIEGESQIDAELLSKTIYDIAKLTNLAAKEENPEAYLKMNVTAFQNGSFEIAFSAICEFAKNLFNNPLELADFAASVVTVVGGFFTLKKHLKGERPKTVSAPDDNGNIRVENKTGDIIEVKKSSGAILNNIRIDQLTVNISEYVKEHNPNGGFTLSTETGSTIYDANDIADISKSLPLEEQKTCKLTRVEVDLPIKKADFLGHSVWEFKYDKHNIKAKVLDDDLIDIAHSGAPFCAGDYIHATLEIRVDLDELSNPIDGTEDYTIINARGGILHKKDNSQTLINGF